ncbi:heterokaryon incompatibility protein-domain-containing protein [Trametes gibbosa]|nr:heterokaryon incompatibility protein-domain-containing protein [Trametes gibbosa]
MRLINTYTGAFEWHHDPTTVRYAILSHVWDLAGEQSYKDVFRIHKQLPRSSPGGGASLPPTFPSQVSAKIRHCCTHARRNGYTLLWIDSCCIDKSSSAELSEAINSMYQWYEQATVCYAFLFDVRSDEDPRGARSSFRRSKWFTRGWTLQELLAPLRVVFLSADWRPLGTLSSLAAVIEEVTGIERGVLLHQTPLRTVSVARRMSWAAQRVTTRVEDEAYSLMGIFGVMMPTIYGEGRNAFGRLQEEILKQAPDQTVFAWGPALCPAAHPDGIRPSVSYFTLDNVLPRERNLFASSPRDFAACAEMEPEAHLSLSERLGGLGVPFPEYTSTGFGIRTRMPILPPAEDATHSIYIGVLACVAGDGNLTGLFLHANRTWMSNGYYIGMDVDAEDTVYRTVPLTDEVLAQWGPPEVAEVYLPTRVMTSSPWTQASSDCTFGQPFATYDIFLPEWRARELEAKGYDVSRVVEPSATRGGLVTKPPTYRFVLVKDGSRAISIEFSSCSCTPGPEENQHGRMRAAVTFQASRPPTADVAANAAVSQPIAQEEHGSPHRAVTHDVAHPDHVNNCGWMLDDESCTAASKDFLCWAEDEHVAEAIRLTLSPSPEQWSADGAPRTWDTVYTLDIEFIDPSDAVATLDS